MVGTKSKTKIIGLIILFLLIPQQPPSFDLVFFSVLQLLHLLLCLTVFSEITLIVLIAVGFFDKKLAQQVDFFAV